MTTNAVGERPGRAGGTLGSVPPAAKTVRLPNGLTLRFIRFETHVLMWAVEAPGVVLHGKTRRWWKQS